MARKEYKFKEVEGPMTLDVTVWYKPEASNVKKPIGELSLPGRTFASAANQLVFYLHGGNFIVGHKDLFPPTYVEALLDLGFGAIVSPNYRLSPTISAYDGAVTDSRDAYIWTQTKLPELLATDTGVKLDPERIVAVGHSAGGTLALLMVSKPAHRLYADFANLG